MKHVLHIVGPTATGKTALALAIAKVFGGELISADSRQVYRGMDSGTGKDIPTGATWQISDYRFAGKAVGYYQTPETKIWGYDLIDPNRDWSIAHFHRFTTGLLRHPKFAPTLPILVGGAGLYHRVLENPPATIGIPQNPQLRQQYQTATAGQLQAVLEKTFPDKLSILNQSDRCNPRRLIRALEIGYYQKRHPKKHFSELKSASYQSRWIGLDLPNEKLEELITLRVKARINLGFTNEFETLMTNKMLLPDSPAATTTGYRQWLAYTKGLSTQEEAIAKWVTAEIQYARRQKTWFKTNPDIIWFSADDPNLKELVVQKIKNWYPNANGK